MIKISKFLKPYLWGVLLVFLFVAARAVIELMLPMYSGDLLKEGLVYGDLLNKVSYNTAAIIKYGLLMFGLIILSIIITVISGYFEAKISAKFGEDLRNAVYKKVQSFSLAEFDKFSTASLITRTTNDISQLQGYINMLMRSVILQPVLAVGAIISVIRISPSLSILLVVSILSVLVMIILIFISIIPKFKIMQKQIDKLNLVTRENLTGLKVVRAFNNEEEQMGKIIKQSEENKLLNISVSKINNLMWPIMSVIMGLTSVLFVYIAVRFGYISFDGTTSSILPEDLLMLIQYGTRTIMSFMFMTMMFIMIPRASVSARRILEVLESDSKVIKSLHPISIDEVKDYSIKFDNVSFKYPDANECVLKNISFTALENKTTAFIGSTGSGKSTLINLIPRFYEITEGDILIGGVSIKDLDENDLTNLIGYVPQKGILFSGDVSSNIKFGYDATDDEVVKASEIAQANNFINELSDGYDSHITQGGTNVSGGQRQRLSIARALVKKPKILIFDDSFSALDYQTDKKLRNELNKNVKATTLVVAQRINTIKDADLIVVLDNGYVVGMGTHQELMKTSNVYREIAYSQLSKEELMKYE